MFKLTERISSFLYNWQIDATENNFVEIFGHEGHGLEFCLFFLLGVSLAFALIFYFVMAKNVSNATPKNYLLMMLMGYIVLVATNYLGFATIYGNEVLSSPNLVMISVVDLLYYVILFEAFSWTFKGMSNASNISLISILFNKK
jgi:hypothetical protein